MNEGHDGDLIKSLEDVTPRDSLRFANELLACGWTDTHHRRIHHWGNDPDRDGSLGRHLSYLEDLAGRSNRFKSEESNNHKVAQRMGYIARRITDAEPNLNDLIEEALEIWPKF